ncbi:hypothetical protein HK44_002120 [Pseudomonas fluorescens HK44]|uniref:Uncharacterized protein n=1 Tax=Pseudomonas fluorescens HK44 TaxID=1042209 RepID=A0A010TAL0_PSEFL|nr:hypothetical protein [Pseudomonas fluorescens]EXF94312.1 hypothetical protein HK44_002120 [Pseudomonas fluorescens HK44]
MEDLEADIGQLWHAAAGVLDARTLQELVDGVAALPQEPPYCGVYWYPVQHIPAALQALLQPYRLERERPSGWRWEASPPSWCFPDGLVEQLSERLAAAMAPV